MLQLVTYDNVFYFNKTLYKQTSGMAMGSPISGSLANIFMGFHESTWLDNCPTDIKPKIYHRYIDDCFLGFDRKEQVEKFLTYLNQQHPAIKFTCEVESNNTLNFLDLSIEHHQGKFQTSTYRKPTYIGLGTNYTSFVPHKSKLNAIRTLLHRAYTASSTWLNFHQEVKFLTNYFEENKFPLILIQNRIKQFLNQLHETRQPTITAKKEIVYVKLQYLGPLSYHTRKLLQKLLTRTYPQLDIRYVFVNKSTIGSLFPFKDKIPDNLQALVCYRYVCIICKHDYVGLTTCNLGKRIADHQGVSERTGRRCKKPYSAILEHQEKTNHPINRSDFKIIGRASHPTELEILEAINIKLLKPKLNTQCEYINLYTV